MAGAFAKALMDQLSATVADKRNKDFYRGLPHVRPGRYVKRQWQRAGKPDSLRRWAKVMAPWDPVVRSVR